MILYRCLHCDHIRNRPCSRVCLLDPEDKDTPSVDTEAPEYWVGERVAEAEVA